MTRRRLRLASQADSADNSEGDSDHYWKGGKSSLVPIRRTVLSLLYGDEEEIRSISCEECKL